MERSDKIRIAAAVAAAAVIWGAALFGGHSKAPEIAEEVDSFSAQTTAKTAETAAVEETAPAAAPDEDEVTYSTEKSVRTVPYKTLYQEDESLEDGEEKLLVKGEKGVVTLTVSNKLSNGRVVATNPIFSEVTKEPVDEIILKGTSPRDEEDEAEDEDTSASATSYNEDEDEEEAYSPAEERQEDEPEDTEETASNEDASNDDDEDVPETDSEEEDVPEDKPEEPEMIPYEEPAQTSAQTSAQTEAAGFIDPAVEYGLAGSSSAPSQISQFDVPSWVRFDANGIPTEYSAVHTGKACAYTANPGALMSTGKAVAQGYVAVNPNIIPYGSELYIVADDGDVYGYAIAADTGYSVKVGDIIVDLFMDEYDDCIQWGNKPVSIYVLSTPEE
ncbi:MAG: G5 domain-containing protein [Oscillospiraceae bacterium]|nr:G5 domain-containing protein [Oscillospiraceae bacterium]